MQMADNDVLLTQLETRVTELERMLKAPIKSKDANRTNLLDTASKVSQDFKKIEAQNEPIKTFFSKWSQVEPLISSLESGEAFLTPEVKLAILLACEENLTQTSNLLQNVQDLEKFVNPPELQTIPSVLNKLAPIEALHLDQKEAASKIGAEVEQHIQTYNSIVSLNTSTYTTIQVDDYIDTKKVNLLSQKFVYWDHMLNLWEQTLDKK